MKSTSLGVGLKNGNWPAAVLLPVRFVGPFLTARFGDARNGPPRAQPKSLAAAQFRFFKQTLGLSAAIAGTLLLLLFATTVQAQARREVNHGSQGYVPSIAAHLTPVGRLEATNLLRLSIGLPLHNQQQLDATLQALYDPASPQYHHWLTPEQFTTAFGPTEQEYQSVVDYMETHGLKVESKYSNRALVSVSGKVPDVEEAFGVTMRVYHHPKENRTFYAADTVPSVDADIPVLGISGLDNFEPQHPVSLLKKSQTFTNYTATGSGPGGLFMGKDFRAAYAPGVSLDGTGQFVALIDGQYYSSDPILYAKDAGLTPPTITNIYVGGSPVGDPPPGTDAGEQSLDISMIMSMAPHATIMVYEGDADACFVQMAIDNKAKQISCSLGWGPASPMLGQEFEEFDAQGQAFFAASGDGGSGGNDSNSSGGGPGAANEYITLVGGTSLTTSGATGPWQSETAWVGSGGAVCVNIPIPSYQQGISMARNQGSIVYRNFPDVAMQADTDIFFIDDGAAGGVGGTSAAAPLWAGFMALVNQQAALQGNPSVGFLNPPLYAVGKSLGYTSAFHDITTGNDENSTYPTMFSAVSGYDLCTGWGSPRGQATINALTGTNTAPNFSLTVPSIIGTMVNDLTVSQGANVTLTVSIISGNGFSGSVSMSALNLPTGVTAMFNPASAASASTVTFTASKTAPISASPATVTVVGTGGDLVRTVTLNLTVVAGTTSGTPEFSLSAFPASLAVTLGGSSASMITVNTVNGFTGGVGLSVSGLPSGVTAAFASTNSTAGSPLFFTADADAATGTNTVTVTGISGSLNNTISLTLVVIATNEMVVPTIANFGFETPSISLGSSLYNPSGASWTFGGTSPDGSGLVANGSSLSNPNAPEGVQAAFLQEYSTISQSLSGFIPGINYTITFAAAERGDGNSGGQTWNVMIDNSVIACYQPGEGATTYTNYTASFTASAPVHTLSFVGTDLGGGNNMVFLDDVSIALATNQFAGPAITLTAPANDAVFTAPATVNLSASVVTNGNLIESVQFYANAALIGQAASAPYTCSWSDVTNGNYDVFAQVVYNGGSIADSTVVNVLITNASSNLGFESPGLGAGIFQYNPPGASWTFNGSAAVTSGSGIVANGSALGNPSAPEGVQAAFLREEGAISQTFGGFTPGVNYTVTYFAAERPGNAQTWNVLLDNSVIHANNAPGSTNYTIYSVTFTASSAVHTLSFVGTDFAGGDNTVFLDNVSITVSENLGFEFPSIGSGNYQYGPIGGGWTFSGNSPQGAGIVANGSGFSNPNAPQGTQAAFLQENGTITEAISGLIPGTNYIITFEAAQRPGNAQSWKVTMNGATIGSYNPGAGVGGYTNYFASFTATAATENLGFVGTDLAGGDNTIFIDAIQINAVAPGTPAAPAGLTTAAGNTQVSLSWMAVNGATSYNVAGSTLDGGPYPALATVTGTNFVNTGLANGTPYYYVVSAVNASGAGANSSQVSATPQLPPPATLTAIAGNEQVNLSWTPSSGAVSYLVQSATVNGGPYSAVGNVVAGTNYVNTGLANGTTYYYVVAAMTASGPTANSVQASATPPGPALTTVSDFGFEIPGIGSGNTNYEYGPVGSGWTFSGNSPQGSGIVGNGTAFSNPNAPEGSQAAFVQDHGTITQTISGFIPGTNYTITFFAAERPGYAPQSWKVTMNSATVGTFYPASSATAYTVYKASFGATAATETLAFVGTDLSGSDSTIFIDDVQIAVSGFTVSPIPQVMTNTLPATAADVVGSQVTFTAGFAAGLPMVFQWQRISGGVTNNIPGATNTTLTLANLQLTNTASYQLQASNALGVAVSSPGSLTVSSAPGAVNNLIASLAAQTGYGGNTTFVPTWTPTTNDSLIAGMAPASTAGDFSLDTAGKTVNSLTAGETLAVGPTSASDTSINYIDCGNSDGAGSMITYTLTGSVSGYDLTNITIYGGWKDAGRDQQAYTVYYSTMAAPATFLLLGTVNYLPANPDGVQCTTRATLTPAAGVLATRVAAIKFDFTTPASENGYCGYTEILMSGAPTPQPVKWAVGNGNWDTTTLNWKLLAGGIATNYIENNLAAFDDSAAGGSPITVTLTGDHFPSILTNNSTKDYILAGAFSITNGRLIKNGAGTLMLDNGGANNFSSIQINNGVVQVGNNDANGSLGAGNVANNGILTFNRTDTFGVSNLISGSGSLVQNGSGTMALSQANTYTGATAVNSGTLALVEPGSLGASALITMASGAILDVSGRADQTLTLNSGETLQGGGSVKGNLNAQAGSTLNPGDTVGPMTVQNNITLNGSLTMELNRTNAPASDELISLAGTITGGGTLFVSNLGPTLQPGDSFHLFSQPVSGFATVNLPSVGVNGWANNLAVNGTISVVSTVAPSVTAQMGVGNLLTLTWPADHTGWQLQVQTNGPTQGLGTNWVNVAASTTTNLMVIPVNGNNGSVFYRLLFQ